MHKPLEKMTVVVLRTIKYGDTSAIVRCYSDLHGTVSFIANGVSTKKGILKPAMIFPLTVLDVVAYKNQHGTLERLKEVHLKSASPGVMGAPVLSGLAAFAAEFFEALVKEETPNYPLFDFLTTCIQNLRDFDDGKQQAHFPLQFILGVLDRLGVLPTSENGRYFNLLEGHFCDTLPEHPYVLSGQDSAAFGQLLGHYHHNQAMDFNKLQRNQLLSHLLQFCKIHHEPHLQLKSVEVIREILQ